MTLLAERYAGLGALPHVRLAETPTRVERLAHASATFGGEVWCKRDDETSREYGGNKVRKLEFLLGDALAKKCDAVITSGASGTHHGLATTTFATKVGLASHLVLAPQQSTPHVEENLRVNLALGAHVHPVPAFAAVPPRVAALKASLRSKGAKPYVIPPGGSSKVGAFGYVEAGLELAKQIARGELPAPTRVFIALGTAGTVAGAAVGLAAMGVQTRVVGVRVTDLIISNRLVMRVLIGGIVKALRHADGRFPDVRKRALAMVEIDHDQFGRGYGYATDASREAVEIAARDGLELENTYTAKCFASLVATARRDPASGPWLYWHTLSSVDLSGRAAESPAVPDKLRKLLR